MPLYNDMKHIERVDLWDFGLLCLLLVSCALHQEIRCSVTASRDILSAGKLSW